MTGKTEDRLLMVTHEQALALAKFCISTKINPAEVLLAVLLNQMGDDFSPEKIDRLKEWAHSIIDSIDAPDSGYVN